MEGTSRSAVSGPKMFSPKSIALTASSIGISNLTDEVAKHVAEEVFYKTQELLHMAKVILYRNKRSTLTTSDVEKAMKLLGGAQTFGNSGDDDPTYQYIPQADVYVQKDSIINVYREALAETSFMMRPEPYVQGSWVTPEACEEPAEPSTYYTLVAKKILIGTPTEIRIALNDLRSNPKIGPDCPYLLNLVALAVKKKLSRDIQLCNNLISTVQAIAYNKFVDMSPYYAVNRAVIALYKIAIDEDLNTDRDEDLSVRRRAGQLLAEVILIWSVELKQKMEIVRNLLHIILQSNVPNSNLHIDYGAIVALIALDKPLDICIWPGIERYLRQREALMDEKEADLQPVIMLKHIMVAILVAARSSYKKEVTTLYSVDETLYSAFGDSITPLRMSDAIPQIYPVVRTGPVRNFNWRLRVKKIDSIAGEGQAQSVIRVTPASPIKPILRPIHTGPRSLTSRYVLPLIWKEKLMPEAVYYVHSMAKKKFAYVWRNSKYTQQRHLTSASGDMHLFL